MNFSGKKPNRFLLLILTIFFILASLGTVQARSKAWYIGAGYAKGSTTGDLNNSQVFYPTDDTVNGPFVYGVDLDDGSGFAINAGYAISKWVAFEVLQTRISQDATSAQYPGETLDANMDSFIFAVRPMLPLGPLEVFGRFGFGAYTLEVRRNTEVIVNPNRKDSTFSGGGYVFGGGVAF